jgi:hypothetical protein
MKNTVVKNILNAVTDPTKTPLAELHPQRSTLIFTRGFTSSQHPSIVPPVVSDINNNSDTNQRRTMH